MSDFYQQMPAPPANESQYPDRFAFDRPGDRVEGVLVDLRMATGGQYEPCPIMDVQTAQVGADGQPVRWSVFCNPWSLWRQLDAQRPQIGQMVRITFTGHEGRSKIFTLEVAPGPGVQQQQVAQPQIAPGPPAPAQTFAPPAQQEQPWAQQPVAPPPAPGPFDAPQPTPAAAPPWGQPG